METHSIVVQY